MKKQMPEMIENEQATGTDAQTSPGTLPETSGDVGTKSETNHQDLSHFLKLAAAQVRNRMKQVEASPSKNQQAEVRESKLRMLTLLEDLIKEQGQTNENSRHSASATR